MGSCSCSPITRTKKKIGDDDDGGDGDDTPEFQFPFNDIDRISAVIRDHGAADDFRMGCVHNALVILDEQDKLKSRDIDVIEPLINEYFHSECSTTTRWLNFFRRCEECNIDKRIYY